MKLRRSTTSGSHILPEGAHEEPLLHGFLQRVEHDLVRQQHVLLKEVVGIRMVGHEATAALPGYRQQGLLFLEDFDLDLVQQKSRGHHNDHELVMKVLFHECGGQLNHRASADFVFPADLIIKTHYWMSEYLFINIKRSPVEECHRLRRTETTSWLGLVTIVQIVLYSLEGIGPGLLQWSVSYVHDFGVNLVCLCIDGRRITRIEVYSSKNVKDHGADGIAHGED